MVSATPDNLFPGMPYTPGAIERPRILSEMRAALLRRLTIVAAPPGYGKSTLVAQFIQAVLSAPDSQHTAAWHTVTERDRDMGNLYRSVLTALQDICPDIHNDLPVPRNLSPAELAVVITDYLDQQMPDKFIFVLDDAHLLARSPDTELWLSTIVQRIPRNCNLILSTRTMPDLPLTDMIARREVLALGQKNLQLNEEEIASLAASMSGQATLGATSSQLVARLEGWVAGVVLALQPLPPEIEHTILSGRGPEALFDTMAEAMLNAQPPGLRNFLLYSSTLQRMTPDLCAAALGLEDSAQWLRETRKRNLFVSEASGGYSYHALFRALLQRTLQHRDPDRFAKLHHHAGEWFEAQDELEEAVEHYLEAGQDQQAKDIIERVASAFLAYERTQTLLDWRARLANRATDMPQLLYNCARIHIDRIEYNEAESTLDKAQAAFAATHDEQGEIETQVRRLQVAERRGNYLEAATGMEQLLPRITQRTTTHGIALRVIGLSRAYLGHIEAGIEDLKQALAIFRDSGDDYVTAHILQDLDFLYSRIGNLEEASKYLQEFVALWRSMGSVLKLAESYNNLGCQYHVRGDYVQARQSFEAGLAALANLPGGKSESVVLWSLGDLERDLGQFTEAEKRYTQALELAGYKDVELRCGILDSLSALRRWQDSPAQAIQIAEEALTHAQENKSALRVNTALAAKWAASAELGQQSDALAHLAEVIHNLEEQNTRIKLMHVLGLHAYVALLLNETAIALEDFDRALEIAAATGSAQILASEIVHIPLLDSFLNEHANRYKTIRREVDKLKKAMQRMVSQEIIIQHVPVSLRIYTLGQELVETNGELVTEWRSTTARELFFYLLFNGELRRDKIALVFWPESNFDEIRSNFHTTLNRVRNALGDTSTVLFDSKKKLYYLNPDMKLWCDALEMATLAERARHLSYRSARAEDLWTRASNLYGGEFLPGLDAEWITLRREGLREIHIETLHGAGNTARARNDFKAALEIFKRAEHEDPYREETHRAILSCYAQLNLRQQLHHHYQNLKVLLRKDLHVEPSPETQSLFHSLANS